MPRFLTTYCLNLCAEKHKARLALAEQGAQQDDLELTQVTSSIRAKPALDAVSHLARSKRSGLGSAAASQAGTF